MSDLLTITNLLTLAVGAAIGQISTSFSARQAKARRRTDELQRAGAALKRHFAELNKFVSDAAAPDKLKLLLLDFSEAISNRETACDFVGRYATQRTSTVTKISSETQEVLNSLQELRVHRSDLAESFDIAMGMGIVAMLLRWTETAEAYSFAASEIVAYRYKEIDFATTIKPRAAWRNPVGLASVS